MNKIYLKKIEKIWLCFSRVSTRKNKNRLYMFAKFSDNFLLNQESKKQKININAISKNSIFTQLNFRVEINEEQYNYFMNIINSEENIDIKILNKEEENKFNNNLRIEQKFASNILDYNFEDLDKKEYYSVNFEIKDEYENLENLERKIKSKISNENFIPSDKILVNLLKQKARIEKTNYRIIAEYISKKEGKNLLYKDYDGIFKTKDLERSIDIGLNKLIFDLNLYDTVYVLIDYEEINKNYIIKGLYIKSEILMNKMIYIGLENLLDYFKNSMEDISNKEILINKVEQSLNKDKIKKF